MIKISTYKSLHLQLKEQGLKFKDGANVSFFEEMLSCIEKLWVYEYVATPEYQKIKNKFLKDLERNLTKIEK